MLETILCEHVENKLVPSLLEDVSCDRFGNHKDMLEITLVEMTELATCTKLGELYIVDMLESLVVILVEHTLYKKQIYIYIYSFSFICVYCNEFEWYT